LISFFIPLNNIAQVF